MLTTIRARLTASLLLTPAIMLMLVWIGRVAGAEEVARMGIVQFLLWAAGAAFGIAATVTLYIAYVKKTADKQ